MNDKVSIAKYNNSWYQPGGFLKRGVWCLVNMVFFMSALPWPRKLKVVLLRLFGAMVGKEVILKPKVNIKYPWFLEIGDYSWVGEGAWIDNLAHVKIGSNVCISQGAYIITGNHDYKKETFDLILGAVSLEDGAWVGAKTIVCPGVTVKTHAVITAGSVVTRDTMPYMVYQGNPAVPVRKRTIEG